MLLHALGVLCGLSAVVFVTLGRRPPSAAAFIAAFGVTALLSSPARLPEPSSVAFAVAAAAALALWKPRWSIVTVAVGGGGAAVWAVLLEGLGLPVAPAHALVAATVLAAAILAARRIDFAPAVLREEALMFIAFFGLVVAVAPAIAAGFETAIALKSVPLDSGAAPAAPWALSLAGGCALSGALYALLKRR